MELSIGLIPPDDSLPQWSSKLGAAILLLEFTTGQAKSHFHRDEFLEARLLFRLAIEVGSNLASEAAVILALHVHKPPIYNPTG